MKKIGWKLLYLGIIAILLSVFEDIKDLSYWEVTFPFFLGWFGWGIFNFIFYKKDVGGI